MKQLITFLFAIVLFGQTMFGADYYVATNGSDSNPGTLASPFATIQHAIDFIAAGDYIYVRGGTYSYSVEVTILSTNDGTSSAIKHLWAYAGEKPVLDFSTQPYGSTSDVDNPRGLSVKGDYWHVKGLEIKGAADNGVFVSGSNNIIELCVIHGNRDSGLQIARLSSTSVAADWPKNNLITKCESYDNYDSPPNAGENADGFACKLTAGTGNKFVDCYSHNNIDDGWDLYTKTETGAIGPVTIDHCISAFNGTLTNGTASSNGDRNGFKLGGEDIAVEHIVTRCVSYQNGKDGFTWNSNPGQIRISNCLAWNNTDANYKFDSPSAAIFTNNLSIWFGATGVNDKYKTGTDVSNTNVWWSKDNKTNPSVNGKGLICTAADFANTLLGSTVSRNADGTLNFSIYKLVAGSDLLDAGVVPAGTLPFDPSTYYVGTPDLGPYEGTSGTTTVAVTGVSLSPTSSTITSANGTVQLTATITPSNATNKNVTWASSNATVAIVSSTGLVTGLSNGSATITVTTTDGSKTATCAITVNITTTTVAVTSVAVSPTSVSVPAGQTTSLVATVSPSNATNKSVTWTSNNTAAATVSSSGVVTGVAAGSATITVTTADGAKTATCAVTVTAVVTPTVVRIEDSATPATGLCSYDGALKAYTGASNGNAINLSNSSAKGINWKVEVAAAGTYTLTWRYVNGASSAATSAKLIVNGTTVNSSVAFPKTVDKATFITTSTTATFVKGVNEIRLETISSSEFADIDWIEVSGGNLVVANCSSANGTSVNLKSEEISVAIQSVENLKIARVYPNPFSGSATISFSLEKKTGVQIKIHDLSGRLIAVIADATFNEGEHEVIYSNSGLKAGIYILSINSDASRQYLRIVVQ